MEDERSELEDLRAALRRRDAEAVENEVQLERYAADLRESFKRERARAQQLRESYVATVRALANAVEARDAYTGQHAERVAAYALRIAVAMDATMADDPQVEFGFLLHDIGKVAIPDAILFKPTPLNAVERTLMERHAEIGWEILREVSWLEEAKLVVRHHHERWDGTGYPDALAGTAIPLAARIFAVADTLVYEARVREAEGVSLVMQRADADAAGLTYDFVAAWITLAVHSSLAGIGLTAAVAAALTERRISCNVIAGYHHDHLLVPIHRADDALVTLRTLSGR